MGAAYGYTKDDLYPFIRSLRATGFSGDVMLLVAEDKNGLYQWLQSEGVRLWRIYPLVGFLPEPWRRRLLSYRLNWVHRHFDAVCDAIGYNRATHRLVKALIAPLFHHIACARYCFYYRYLWTHRNHYDHILIADCRDVIFQTNPFLRAKGECLKCFLEGSKYSIQSEQWNAAWVEDIYGSRVLAQIGDDYVSCSGVTIGPTESLLGYLGYMIDEISRATVRINGCAGYDQGIHNYLIRSKTLKAVELCGNGEDLVLTMSGIDASEVNFVGGQIVGPGHEVIPIIHQYDRVSEIRDHLLRGILL
ncbi:MAG: hypothetical protein WCA95_00050 [Opitutaceae bacterium]